jgi:hypothetical protein
MFPESPSMWRLGAPFKISRAPSRSGCSCLRFSSHAAAATIRVGGARHPTRSLRHSTVTRGPRPTSATLAICGTQSPSITAFLTRINSSGMIKAGPLHDCGPSAAALTGRRLRLARARSRWPPAGGQPPSAAGLGRSRLSFDYRFPRALLSVTVMVVPRVDMGRGSPSPSPRPLRRAAAGGPRRWSTRRDDLVG